MSRHLWIVALAAMVSLTSQAEDAASRGPVTTSGNRGPSTNSGSFLVPVAPNVKCISILTNGETVNNKPDGSPYRMVGIPDGLGIFDNGDGTLTMVSNHELGNTQGQGRRHHGASNQSEGITTAPTSAGKGAFVSRWIINHTTLAVLSGNDQDRCGQVNLWDRTAQKFVKNPNAAGVAGTDITNLALLNFHRFCSADLAATTAYRNSITTTDASKFQFATAAATGVTFGTRTRIFLNGEEGATNRAFAHYLNGSNEGVAFELPAFGNLNWENLVACPAEQDKTVVMGDDDTSGATASGYVVMFVGTKNANQSAVSPAPYPGYGTDADQAGLIKGTLYGLKVTGVAAEDRDTALGAAKGVDVPFTMVALSDQSLNTANTRAELQSPTVAATPFLRPEDGAWNPVNKNVYYFVTTDRMDTIKNPEAATFTQFDPATQTRTPVSINPTGQVGRSRLWRLTFDDISNPDKGGKIAMLVDGTEGHQMFDNICVDPAGANIVLCEDPGDNDYVAKVWNYNIKSGALTVIAQFDPARFDPSKAVQTPVDQFLTSDEETSGVIEAFSTLGNGWFLIDLQIHNPKSGAGQSAEIVERGQYVALFNPLAATPPTVNTTSSSAKLQTNPASPNVGASATVSVVGTTTTGGTILWEIDFGDGTAKFKATSGTASGATFSTTHTWAAMGTYTITATGTDSVSGQQTVQTAKITVKDTVRSGKALFRLSFTETGKDAVQVFGALPLPIATELAGDVLVDIGGFQKTFTLNDKGEGKDGKNIFKIFKKHKGEGITSVQSKFFVKLFDQDLKPALVDEGLIDKNADRESKSVKVVITFQGIPYDATLTVTYIAQQGKRGFTR